MALIPWWKEDLFIYIIFKVIEFQFEKVDAWSSTNITSIFRFKQVS